MKKYITKTLSLLMALLMTLVMPMCAQAATPSVSISAEDNCANDYYYEDQDSKLYVNYNATANTGKSTYNDDFLGKKIYNYGTGVATLNVSLKGFKTSGLRLEMGNLNATWTKKSATTGVLKVTMESSSSPTKTPYGYVKFIKTSTGKTVRQLKVVELKEFEPSSDIALNVEAASKGDGTTSTSLTQSDFDKTSRYITYVGETLTVTPSSQPEIANEGDLIQYDQFIFHIYKYEKGKYKKIDKKYFTYSVNKSEGSKSYNLTLKKKGTYKVVLTIQSFHNYLPRSSTKVSTLISVEPLAKAKLLSVKSYDNALSVSFNKVDPQSASYLDEKISGYQIQASTSSSFAKGSTKTVKVDKTSFATKAITGLKSNKKYYIRIRTYKKDVSGQKVYSTWSKVKTAVTK